MKHKNPLPKNSIRIATGMFTISEEFGPTYVSFKINGKGIEDLYLRFLNEKKGTCVKRHLEKGIYESTVPFNIKGKGTFRLENITLDDIEYYKVGEKIINGRKYFSV